MNHSEYVEYTEQQSEIFGDDPGFSGALKEFRKEFSIISGINLDPAAPVLTPLYCPVNYSAPRDPVCMLRSLLLMTLFRDYGITAWGAGRHGQFPPLRSCADSIPVIRRESEHTMIL
ncbi:MAG: hypothetical protein GY795_15690 [Desulfobacterales bacterium]|nr:hypothetical protein [Desulfobacterales bacterium]